MFERLSEKIECPHMDEFITHIGTCKELFMNIDNFLKDELNAESMLRYSVDSSVRAWGMKYSRKTKYFCDIIAEKDAFTVVMRLSDEQIKRAYEEVLPYAKECLNNYHRTSNGGWVQYRILNLEHLNDAKKILLIRNK